MNWKLWGRGLFAAFISSAANGLAAWSLDPGDFNLHAGLVKIGKLAVVSGLIGAALYLKTHPTPWDGEYITRGK
jgi:hypothetical protein